MRHSRLDRWFALALLLALPTLVPLLVIGGSFLTPDPPTWDHLSQYVLPRVAANTAWLTAGTAIVTFLLGTSLAWLTAVHDFPGRRFFAWSLMLPIAIPGYVLAFVFLGIFDYAGPLQSALRGWIGDGIVLPPVSRRVSTILVLGLALYPYVYLLARGAFLSQGARALEVGQSLGLSRTRSFWRVALPLARPWIAGGIMLVVMETMADFGTVSVFNYDTFTTAIYQTWFGLFSVAGALQLASVLLLFVLAAVVVEKRLRARALYVALQGNGGSRIRLAGAARWLAAGYCAGILAIAFIVPALQLLSWSLPALQTDLDVRYVGFVTHSLSLSIIGALLTLGAATLLAYAARNNVTPPTRFAVRLSTLGYALPGTILAVGLFVPVAGLNNVLQRVVDSVTSDGVSLTLQNTLLVMLLAYGVRFLAVAYTPVESHMQRLATSVEDASRGLGVSGLEMLRRVHWPVVRSGCLIGAILVFVDIMKEMPITLMTRPFGWDTLAVRVFELTAEGEWERAALPSLAIVLTDLIPVALLVRFSDHVAATR